MLDDDRSRRDIKQYVNRELLPRIENLKATREHKTRLFYVSAVASTAVVLAMLAVAGYTLEIDEVATVEFGVAIGVIVAYGLALHGVFHVLFVKDARREYVERVVAPLVSRLRPDIDYELEESISRRDFQDSAIAQVPIQRFDSRDRFDVELPGVRIRCSELQAQTRVREADRSFGLKKRCYLLRGLFFAARVDQSFDGTTVIFPTLRRFTNVDELPRVDVPGGEPDPVVRPAADWPHLEWMPEHHPEPMREVNLPDPEFHHLFDCYTTAVGESRDLLRPPVVERIKSVYSVWKSDVHRSPVTRTAGQGHFILVIRGDHVYLGRPMPRKLSEMRAFDAADQTEYLVQFSRDLELGIDLIEGVAGRGLEPADDADPEAGFPTGLP